MFVGLCLPCIMCLVEVYQSLIFALCRVEDMGDAILAQERHVGCRSLVTHEQSRVDLIAVNSPLDSELRTSRMNECEEAIVVMPTFSSIPSKYAKRHTGLKLRVLEIFNLIETS